MNILKPALLFLFLLFTFFACLFGLIYFIDVIWIHSSSAKMETIWQMAILYGTLALLCHAGRREIPRYQRKKGDSDYYY